LVVGFLFNPNCVLSQEITNWREIPVSVKICGVKYTPEMFRFGLDDEVQKKKVGKLKMSSELGEGTFIIESRPTNTNLRLVIYPSNLGFVVSEFEFDLSEIAEIDFYIMKTKFKNKIIYDTYSDLHYIAVVVFKNVEGEIIRKSDYSIPFKFFEKGIRKILRKAPAQECEFDPFISLEVRCK